MNVMIAIAGMLAVLTAAEPDKKEPESPRKGASGEDRTSDKPEKKGPPFGEAPKTVEEPKPPERTWTVRSGEYSFSVAMKPGIPDPDQVTEVIINANLIPKTSDPKYGNRVPVEGAALTVDLMNPGGEVVQRFLAHPMPLASGKYGLHITAQHEGIYTLAIRGSTADGKPLTGDVKLPVKVWPLPAELKGAGDGAEKTSGRKPLIGG